MNLKIITFFPKNLSVPKWIPDFTSGDVVRFTGNFSLNEPPHDDILEITTNMNALKVEILAQNPLPI
ncbi:unnamed protein product [Rhizophagus irregularis]|nr:unnamed protein product [Rhizophagus irregularis]